MLGCVEMMWLMLQQAKPDDYVATGRMETVRKFIEISADKIGWGKNLVDPTLSGKGRYE